MVSLSILKFRSFLRNIYYSYFKEFKFKSEEFPRVIQLETSIICNGKCKICPSNNIKRKPLMDESLFKKIILECKNTRLEEIHPFFFNEPFLFPKFLDWLKYMKKEIPSVKICVTTNGSLFNEEICDLILQENLIDNLCFSLDAYSSKTFKESRGLDNLGEIIKNILYLKNKCFNNLSVNFTVNKYNYFELDEFKKFWKKERIPVFINYDDGRKDGKPLIKRKYSHPCKQPFDYLTILTTGEIVLCDMDALGNHMLGDLRKQTIKEVWNSETFKVIRKKHLIGQRDSLPICKKCQITWT